MTEQIRSEIIHAHLDYESAVARQSGIQIAKERLKNILFTYSNEIVEMVDGNKKVTAELAALRDERDMLATALHEADIENDKLRKSVAKTGK